MRSQPHGLLLTVINCHVLLDEIHASFCRFGSLTVDWPHKAESKSYFPPKGKLTEQHTGKSLLSHICLSLNRLCSYGFSGSMIFQEIPVITVII